ncbi:MULTISPECIES: DUF6299 family protein [Streptomyces]|uniref:DUF6299 domain-containing protein n=2 Tax=Streptomyces TaxID=1883 RepID=A0A0W7X818_9ACTN|nr:MULTISPECIES: DUF6299 family protein [Streptomyces]KUF19129.1 hypothetical protein AT728_21395 [Streptomyces silvensis]MVO88450.1 hypothetical protein [Streptomyces typhae]
MPVRPVLGAVLCTAAVLCAAAGPAAAGAGERVTVDPAGTVSKDHTVTLSGTYRCADAVGPVFVTAAVSQRDPRVKRSLNGGRAVCDGAEHRWQSSGTLTPGAVTPGAAGVEVTLMELRSTGGLPLPHFHAVQRQNVTLTGKG